MAGARNDDKLWPNVNKHLPYIIEIENKLRTTTDSQKANEEIENLYRYFKLLMLEFSSDNEIDGGLRYLIYRLLECENLLPKDFIINIDSNFKENFKKEKFPDTKDISYKLDWIVYMTRKYLLYRNFFQDKNIDRIDLSNQCNVASKKVKEFADILGLNCKNYVIYPGFTKYPELYNGNGYHCISIITDDNKTYIVDCTYSQFFTLKANNLERIGLIGISGCLPGIFMTLDEQREKIARELIKTGWIKGTKENVKLYFDGFAVSYRNGLYYQVTGDYSYQTAYDYLNYIDFIKKIDNQINHEGEELLGYQRTLKPKNKY